MNLLIIGGAGYIGSHTSNLLIEAGHTVTVIDDLSTGFAESLDSRAKLYVGSILNQSFLKNCFSENKFDAVLHFAAKLIVLESVENPQLYYVNNTAGSLNIFSECIKNNVKKIVFSSTASVYGNSSSKLIYENEECFPINPYGQSKLMVEQSLKDYSLAYGLDYAILRYFNVAGAHINNSNGQRTAGATHLIKVAAEAACGKRSQVNVYGTQYSTQDGTCIRDYIHILDLAQAHLNALDYLAEGGESDIFNCGYGKGSSVLDVLTSMKRISNSDFQIINENPRIGDPVSVVAANSKIISKLNWKPKYDDLDLICRTSYDWEKLL